MRVFTVADKTQELVSINAMHIVHFRDQKGKFWKLKTHFRSQTDKVWKSKPHFRNQTDNLNQEIKKSFQKSNVQDENQNR